MRQTGDYSINLSEDTLNECENFYYIGSGCFYYNEGIFINGDNGKCEDKYLHITGIPIDDFANEPIVLEIEW